MSTNDTDRDGQEGGKHRRRQTCSVCKGEGGHYISTNGNGPERKERVEALRILPRHREDMTCE